MFVEESRLVCIKFDANKKVKGIKRNIAVDRNGFILGRYVSSAGIHDSRLASPVCEQVSDAWPSVRKGLVDRGYRGELIENIKRDFNIDIEVCSTPTEQTDSLQNRFDGWWNALSHGWMVFVGLHEIMKSPMIPLRSHAQTVA